MKKIGKKKAFELINKGAMLIDLRSPVDFRDGTITGAVNLPLKNFTNKLMGFDKKKKYVLIGKTVEDTDLKAAVNYAEQLGIETVSVVGYDQMIAD